MLFSLFDLQHKKLMYQNREKYKDDNCNRKQTAFYIVDNNLFN